MRLRRLAGRVRRWTRRAVGGSYHAPRVMPPLETPEAQASARHLHQTVTQRFSERRRVEWRFAFSIWVALVAVESFDLGRWVTLGYGLVLTLAHAVLEARYFIGASRRDWAEGIVLDWRIRKAVGFPTRSRPNLARDYSPFFAHWWLVLVTAALASAIVIAQRC